MTSGAFSLLPRRRRRPLLQRQRVAARALVPVFGHRNPRRARLRVPALELREIAPRRVLEYRQPVLDRAGLPVMPLEIEVQRAAVRLRPDQGAQHPDDLGALLVDRRRVEVVDLDVFLRADGVRQRAGVLAELARAQCLHVADPVHRRRALVLRELLVAEDGQPLLQAELEPVAAGDPVACPVVEVLVRDDRLDHLVVAVGGRLGAGQHVF